MEVSEKENKKSNRMFSLQWRFPPEALPSSTNGILLLLVTVFMPSEALLVEGYDDLWTLMIGLLGKNEIRFI